MPLFKNERNADNDNKSNCFLLIGRPNVGKTTIFNRITNSVNVVGNFQKTTVSSKIGKIKSSNSYVMDLPGIFNLSSNDEDEKIAINEILNKKYSGIINIINANTFKRDILLTLQILESDQNVFININMVDELNQKRIISSEISKKLRCSVNLTIANKNIGLNKIKDEIKCPIKGFRLNYGVDVEKKINEIIEKIDFECKSKRFLAIQLLEKNENAIIYLNENSKNANQILELIDQKNEYSQNIIKKRNRFINNLYMKSFIFDEKIIYNENYFSKKIDFLLLKNYIGLPTFFLALMGVYYITFGPYMGGFLQDRADWFFNDFLLNKISTCFKNINTPWWLLSFLCDGIIKGVFGVIPFFVYIIILFFLVGVFQQSGYMSRISIVTDQLLNKFGLSGRSIIALISGMGCNVPAIMMARGSSNKKERLTSIFIAPFISCSARATVFAFIASLIFTSNIWLIVFLLQLFSGLIAIFIGLIFSKTMFRKSPYTLIFEIPKWRVPDFKSIRKLMWFECKTFSQRVVKFVLIGSMILWFLIHFGSTGLLKNDQIQNSFIMYIAKYISYLNTPIGLNDYRVTASLILAIPAKELAISNMIIIFGSTQNISNYFTFANALSYMIFFLLYIPCISTLATIKKETNWKLLSANIATSLIIAWLASLFVYQLCLLF